MSAIYQSVVLTDADPSPTVYTTDEGVPIISFVPPSDLGGVGSVTVHLSVSDPVGTLDRFIGDLSDLRDELNLRGIEAEQPSEVCS